MTLTSDIWQEICKHLPIEDIKSILILNKYINQIDEYIWGYLIYRDFNEDMIFYKLIGECSDKEEYKLYYEKYEIVRHMKVISSIMDAVINGTQSFKKL